MVVASGCPRGLEGFLVYVCRGLGSNLKILDGSKLRLPRAIRWSKNFFITKKLINNLYSQSEVTEKGLNFTSFCEAGCTNLRFSTGRNSRLAMGKDLKSRRLVNRLSWGRLVTLLNAGPTLLAKLWWVDSSI